MLTPPQGQRRKDRPSVSIVPQQNLRTDIQSPCLHVLFQESDLFLRVCDDNTEDTFIRRNQEKTQDTTMAEVIDFLNHQERDVFWHQPRTPHDVMPSHRQMVAPLDAPFLHAIKHLPDVEAFDLVAELIAIQLLASCYTLLPATSAHLPLNQQRMGSRVITALRLHMLHQLAPAAGHHARDNTAASPWPSFFNSLSRENELGARHALEAPRDDDYWPCQDSMTNECAERASYQNDGTEDSSSPPATTGPRKSPPWTRLVSKLPWKPTKRQDLRKSEEFSQTKAAIAPRSSTQQASSSATRLKKPLARRLRRAQSNERRPRALTEVPAPTDHMSRSVSSPIPVIRRISASPNSQASDRTTTRAQPVSRSEPLVEAPTTFIECMEKDPSDTRYSPQPATEGISPYFSSSVLEDESKSSSLSTSPTSTREEASQPAEIQESPISEVKTESNDDSYSSDDSNRHERRNRCVIGAAADKMVDFAAELRRRATGASEEERGSGGI